MNKQKQWLKPCTVELVHLLNKQKCSDTLQKSGTKPVLKFGLRNKPKKVYIHNENKGLQTEPQKGFRTNSKIQIKCSAPEQKKGFSAWTKKNVQDLNQKNKGLESKQKNGFIILSKKSVKHLNQKQVLCFHQKKGTASEPKKMFRTWTKSWTKNSVKRLNQKKSV